MAAFPITARSKTSKGFDAKLAMSSEKIRSAGSVHEENSATLAGAPG
jgi:hypothetical protein